MAKRKTLKTFKVEVYPQPTEIEVQAKDLTDAIKNGLAEFNKQYPTILVSGVNAKEKSKK